MLIKIFKLLTSSLIASILAFLIQVILARELTLVNFGKLSATLALCSIITPLIGFGLDGYIYKHNAYLPNTLNQLLISSYKYVIGTSIICLSTFYIFSLDYFYIKIFAITMLSQFLLNIALAILQVRARYNFFSLLSILQSFTRISLIVGCILLFGSIDISTIALSYVGSSIIIFSISVFIICRESFKDESDKVISKHWIIKNSFPFGIGTICHLIYFQSDIVLLHYYTSSESSGIYAIAFILISMTYIVLN
jgi:O-antigen/teichoic acid export membrane protein